MLEPVTTTLQDIQKKLREILHPRTILIGHSLNSDLNALKLTHPFIIDTAVLYPHPRGPPLKSSLKWLAQKYLNREIQKGHGTTGPGAGHDSIEDARTCLDLVKQKCEKGKEWGTSDAQGENIFKRVARAGIRYKSQGGAAIPSALGAKSSTMIDWGDPKKGPGGAATFTIGCTSDEEVKDGIIRAVKGDHDGKEIPGGGVDFVWARFRELEDVKGWNNVRLSRAENTAALENSAVAGTASQNKETVAEESGSSGKDESTKKDSTKEDKPAAEESSKSEENGENESTPVEKSTVAAETTDSVANASAALSRRIAEIHDALPPCTALIIYSGSGDPREMAKLQALQAQFKREFKVKKWDELSVKWTDVEEQALKRAVKVARDGIGFVGVK